MHRDTIGLLSLQFAKSFSSLSDAATARSRTEHCVDNKGGPIDLQPQTRLDIVNQIKTTVGQVLDSMVGDGPSKTYWRPKGAKNDVSFFVDDNVESGQYRFCCVSETTVRTEDIMPLFVVTDTKGLRKSNRVLYDNVLDARVLSVLERPTQHTPFKSIYLRYSSFEAPTFMHNRDVCVVVATDMFTHDDGSTIGYCLYDSVEIPDCPDYSARGLVRSRMFRSGFFCCTTNDRLGDSPTTKIVYLLGLEPGGGSVARFAGWRFMERFGDVLSRLCAHVRRQNLDPTTFRPRREWPSARTAKTCRGCATRLTRSFTTRHHCAACGEVFCKACCTPECVDLPGVGRTRVRVCTNCLCLRGMHACDTACQPTTSRRPMALRRWHSDPTTTTMDDAAPVGTPQLLDDDAAVLWMHPQVEVEYRIS